MGGKEGGVGVEGGRKPVRQGGREGGREVGREGGRDGYSIISHNYHW